MSSNVSKLLALHENSSVVVRTARIEHASAEWRSAIEPINQVRVGEGRIRTSEPKKTGRRLQRRCFGLLHTRPN